jgi:hypothetical protein
VNVRERLSLDFGWRFHLGHADDSTKDFGFSNGRTREFQKTGNFLPVAALAYDDSDWETLDVPHDWAISLPFKDDPALTSKGSYPIGRAYPETSVGWYRRIFEIPETDQGKRISVEFDGVYREALVVLNGYYIGQHRGGYDAFSFDLTDFLIFGAPNVLTVRVDATLSDGCQPRRRHRLHRGKERCPAARERALGRTALEPRKEDPRLARCRMVQILRWAAVEGKASRRSFCEGPDARLRVHQVKAFDGLPPSFSSHLRFGERGAPVQFPPALRVTCGV